jgi:hypothetical protein
MTWIFLWDSAPSKVFVWDSEVSKVFVGDTKVRPTGWGWWTPWPNTILYFPLQSDVVDTIAGVSLTPGWWTAPTYETPTWVSIPCAKFSKWMWKMAGTVSQLINGTWARTISGWVCPSRNDSRFAVASYWASSSNQAFSLYTYDGSSDNDKLRFTSYGYDSNYWTTSININTWYNIVVTYDSWIIKWYVNAVLDGSFTQTLNTSKNRLTLWADSTTSASITMPKKWLYGYLSSVIFENVAWSLTDILNYYNNNKSIYGIS